MSGRSPALLVFSDDWGRHPSSCQHLVRHLLNEHEVYWVNTIGTRTPRFDFATLVRGLEKVRQWIRPPRSEIALPSHLHVLNPRMWPWFGSRLSRRLNRALMLRQLTPVLKSLPVPVVAITTIPLVADLMGRLPVGRWVYYCVDDFGQWPGLDQATLRQMEEQVVARADVVVAVSETLRDRLAQMGRTSHLLTHGVDLEFWERADTCEKLPLLEGLERPLVVFWGVTDRRMDIAFIKRLAADLSAGTILLVGPEADPDPALYATPRVVHRPPLPFSELPALARAASVLIMPYADLPVTQAIQPLKLKEYLATGRPTVVRTLPATREWADCLDLADTPECFSAAVRRRIADGLPLSQEAARKRLARERWAEKAEEFTRFALTTEPASVETSRSCQGPTADASRT